MGSVDGDRDGTDSGNSLGEGLLVLTSNVNVALLCGTNVTGVEAAFLVPSHIGVAGLSIDSIILDDVFESVVHESTVASLVALRSRAVDEILLTQGDQIPSLESMLSLKRAGGAEGPAGAALALVLDWGDDILCTPVHSHTVRESGTSGVENLGGVRATTGLIAVEELCEFCSVQVGVLVHPKSEAEAVGQVLVVLVHVLLVGLPDGVAAELDRLAVVILVILLEAQKNNQAYG